MHDELPNIKRRKQQMKLLFKQRLFSWFDSNHQFEGVIKEVSDSAILVEKNGTVEAINLDFVIRIREFPKK